MSARWAAHLLRNHLGRHCRHFISGEQEGGQEDGREEGGGEEEEEEEEGREKEEGKERGVCQGAFLGPQARSLFTDPHSYTSSCPALDHDSGASYSPADDTRKHTHARARTHTHSSSS